MQTRTGQFPIAFRRGWAPWTKDLRSLAAWARDNGFEAIDLMNLTPADVQTMTATGLRLGSVDLLDFGNLMHTDAARRNELIEKNIAYMRQLAPLGAKVFFTCVMPGDVTKPRGENYKLAVEVFKPLALAADQVGAKIAIEGWPGGAPHLANLCCTPETYRAIIRDVGGQSIGVNYDPSHLIRLGVDHVRFLREFVGHVWHVHAKDTELYPETIYELGTHQGSAFAEIHPYGEHTWRYTIPGHGCARWTEIFSILQAAGYRGLVSIELEDRDFNGSEDGEKAGLIHSRDFLRGA